MSRPEIEGERGSKFKLGLYASIDSNNNLIIYGKAPRPAPPEAKVKGLISVGGEIIINPDRNPELFNHVREMMKVNGDVVALDVDLKTKKARKKHE